MKISEIKNGNTATYIREFKSLQEFTAHTSMQEINKTSFPTQSSITGDRSFTMTSSYQEAENLMRDGWDQGTKKLKTSLDLANSKPAPREVQRAMHDVVGFQASVPRYLQGIPTNMVNKKKVIQKQKVVTLIKSISYSARIKPQQILDDSVKFLQLIQGLEKQGMRVNADVAFHARTDQEEMYIRIRIKSAGERLNLSKMSFPLMHPSFLRRIIFRAMETEGRVSNRSWYYGYGYPMPSSDTRKLLQENEYFIPVLISEVRMKEILNQAVNK